MNVWMRDARIEKAEVKAFEADRAERSGDLAKAREQYHDAAEAFASVALAVPADYPNTRSDLAIAAVASFARAGDFGRAIEFARRMLAESGALTAYGHGEISRLAREYAVLVATSLPRTVASSRGGSVREDVRNRFKSKRAA